MWLQLWMWLCGCVPESCVGPKDIRFCGLFISELGVFPIGTRALQTIAAGSLLSNLFPPPLSPSPSSLSPFFLPFLSLPASFPSFLVCTSFQAYRALALGQVLCWDYLSLVFSPHKLTHQSAMVTDLLFSNFIMKASSWQGLGLAWLFVPLSKSLLVMLCCSASSSGTKGMWERDRGVLWMSGLFWWRQGRQRI